MGAPKGRPKPEGSGRKKGSIYPETKLLKDMILCALSDAGGQAYLARQAEENPGPFLTLVGKVLPLTVAGNMGIGIVIQASKTDEDL